MKVDNQPYLYDEAQLKTVDEHIEKYFGKPSSVLHEFASLGVHIDVEIVEPTSERNYYTLITIGMGSYKMKVPGYYSDEGIDRAELIMCLPPDWNVKSMADNDRWPADLLKWLARLPLEENAWLGYGHTIPNGQPFAENTSLSACVLLGIQDAPQGAATCDLPNGERIVYYQVIPLYENELEFKLKNGMAKLLEHMDDVDHVVDINRSNVFPIG